MSQIIAKQVCPRLHQKTHFKATIDEFNNNYQKHNNDILSDSILNDNRHEHKRRSSLYLENPIQSSYQNKASIILNNINLIKNKNQSVKILHKGQGNNASMTNFSNDPIIDSFYQCQKQ